MASKLELIENGLRDNPEIVYKEKYTTTYNLLDENKWTYCEKKEILEEGIKKSILGREVIIPVAPKDGCYTMESLTEFYNDLSKHLSELSPELKPKHTLWNCEVYGLSSPSEGMFPCDREPSTKFMSYDRVYEPGIIIFEEDIGKIIWSKPIIELYDKDIEKEVSGTEIHLDTKNQLPEIPIVRRTALIVYPDLGLCKLPKDLNINFMDCWEPGEVPKEYEQICYSTEFEFFPEPKWKEAKKTEAFFESQKV